MCPSHPLIRDHHIPHFALEAVQLYIWSPDTIIIRSPFHSQKCSGLDDKLYGHSIHKSRRKVQAPYLHIYTWSRFPLCMWITGHSTDSCVQFLPSCVKMESIKSIFPLAFHYKTKLPAIKAQFVSFVWIKHLQLLWNIIWD